MPNRDNSQEKPEMVASKADVAPKLRRQICKAARRFERFGHVKDGQDLVKFVGDMAGSVEGKPEEVEAVRRRRPGA